MSAAAAPAAAADAVASVAPLDAETRLNVTAGARGGQETDSDDGFSDQRLLSNDEIDLNLLYFLVTPIPSTAGAPPPDLDPGTLQCFVDDRSGGAMVSWKPLVGYGSGDTEIELGLVATMVPNNTTLGWSRGEVALSSHVSAVVAQERRKERTGARKRFRPRKGARGLGFRVAVRPLQTAPFSNQDSGDFHASGDVLVADVGFFRPAPATSVLYLTNLPEKWQSGCDDDLLRAMDLDPDHPINSVNYPVGNPATAFVTTSSDFCMHILENYSILPGVTIAPGRKCAPLHHYCDDELFVAMVSRCNSEADACAELLSFLSDPSSLPAVDSWKTWSRPYGPRKLGTRLWSFLIPLPSHDLTATTGIMNELYPHVRPAGGRVRYSYNRCVPPQTDNSRWYAVNGYDTLSDRRRSNFISTFSSIPGAKVYEFISPSRIHSVLAKVPPGPTTVEIERKAITDIRFVPGLFLHKIRSIAFGGRPPDVVVASIRSLLATPVLSELQREG